MRTEVTREEFLAQRPDRAHDEEFHHAAGATCFWREGGKTFEERQPDLGPARWFVTE